MPELAVPVALDQIDQIHAFLDAELARQGCPTILRLRVAMVAEELFSAALDYLGGGTGTMICASGGEPGVFFFRFLSPQGPFSPDHSGLDGLLGRPCTYGLTIGRHKTGCTVAVGRRPS